jgi:hypothetical protein
MDLLLIMELKIVSTILGHAIFSRVMTLMIKNFGKFEVMMHFMIVY